MKTKLTLIMLIAGFLCVQSQTWTWFEDELSYARTGLSVTVLDDTIFFSGGQGPNYIYSSIIVASNFICYLFLDAIYWLYQCLHLICLLELYGHNLLQDRRSW